MTYRWFSLQRMAADHEQLHQGVSRPLTGSTASRRGRRRHLAAQQPAVDVQVGLRLRRPRHGGVAGVGELDPNVQHRLPGVTGPAP
jgi:hypothetical protein